MDSYEDPLHIVSEQTSELSMTFAQKNVEGKSNEIPAFQEFIKELGNADYLLRAKDNQYTFSGNVDKYSISLFILDKSSLDPVRICSIK